MANTADPEKEANPIAEIFDEMFTLMQDLETRSVAVFEYMQEQGGATDEKLAPYLDRAAGAADVRWRAARARMEHLPSTTNPKARLSRSHKKKGRIQTPAARNRRARNGKAQSLSQKIWAKN
jgi:hypothetical protein